MTKLDHGVTGFKTLLNELFIIMYENAELLDEVERKN
jgi:hypothetical protein